MYFLKYILNKNKQTKDVLNTEEKILYGPVQRIKQQQQQQNSGITTIDN